MDISLFAVLASIPFLKRNECRDHAFGDCEVFISHEEAEAGFGYFGSRSSSIRIFGYAFSGDAAHLVRSQIPLGKVDRNDQTGPETFAIGAVLPGLTLEGVREELYG